MTALYVLANEYRQAADKLADMDLDEQTIADTLDGLSGELEDKATNVMMFARNLEATAEQIKAAEAQMAARRKAIERKADGLRRYVLGAMQATGIKKIACPHFEMSVRANPPAVEVFDKDQVPSFYMREPEPQPPVPDKSAIKAELQAGRDVPGCRLASSHRLEIK